MEKKMNREWVKTAAIIFLAVLLVLTFFSNTIMNRTLPEVASSEVTDGSITAKVRGTGVVSAIGNTEIKANGTQSVATVKAKEGAEVSAGDVLFIMGEASEELEAAQESLDNARFSLMDAQNSYPIDTGSIELQYASIELGEAQYALEQAIAASKDDAVVKDCESKIKDLQNQMLPLESTYNQAISKIAECEAKLAEAETTFALAESAYYDDPTSTAKENNYNSAKTALTTAQNNLNTAKTAEVISQYEDLEDKLVEQQNKLSARLDVINSDYETAYKRVQAAETAYNQAEAAADASYASNGKSSASASIAVARAQKEVERWEKKVAELSGGEDNAITAPIAGTISSLSVSPGDKVQKDQVMCIIEVPDLGYQMSFSATNDQAKRIKVGNKADVSNFYWGSTIEAEVASIKVDPKDPQNKKLVTVNLDGDVTTGADITVSIGEKSANYDVIVPNSAVRTDSNGSFVLAITAKNSPLGNRYFATRVPVEVLASDDSNSALNGNLSYGDFVITTSSSPIKNGDQVRLAANG